MFVLAATNTPWAIDAAMLRRLEKRVYVPAPNEEARKEIIVKLIGDRIKDQSLIDHMVTASENWAASDVCALCREAAMEKLRTELDLVEG